MKGVTQAVYMGLLALTLSAPALAGDSGRVPTPHIPEAKGDKCVEDTSVMRKKHMDFLLHHRDQTMHEGIRTKKYSLKECIECHVPATNTGASSDQHFCKNCHLYAAVRIDCFECHATRPEKSAQRGPSAAPEMWASGLNPIGTNGFAGAEKNKTGAMQ